MIPNSGFLGGENFVTVTILKTLYLTGIRVSELCGLKWKDGTSSRGGGGQINIYGKGGRTRRVHVPQELWVELIQLRNEMRSDSPMFPSATGAALAPSHIDLLVVEIWIYMLNFFY